MKHRPKVSLSVIGLLLVSNSSFGFHAFHHVAKKNLHPHHRERHSFLSRPSQSVDPPSTSTKVTALFLSDPKRGAANDNQKKIPVLGPFPNAPPLVVGGTQWLSPPTPLQWKTIEFCVESLYRNDNFGNDGVARVRAAPLVAILTPNSEIATLAAIVGIQKGSIENEDDSRSIDTTDSASLQESLARVSRASAPSMQPYYNENAKVRLLGVGRTKLTDLKSYIHRDPNNNNNNNNNEEENADNDELIVMASMQLVLDGPAKQQKKSGEVRRQASPVHALNELSVWTSRIGFLHEDRQKLVRGLQAAQARLDGASEEWQDWDGIGTLFTEEERRVNNEGLDETLQQFLAMTLEDELMSLEGEETINLESSVPLSAEALRVTKLDNYGLGTTPSAYSDLRSLSTVLKRQLQPYYSPSRAESEEFDYCMVSWVALQSLQAYFPKDHRDVKTLMEYYNTVERMQRLYDAMLAHKQTLQELARAKSRELMNCGEESVLALFPQEILLQNVIPIMGDDNNSTLSTSNSSLVGDEQQPNVFVYTQELKNNVPSGSTELEDDLTYQYNQTKQELGEQKEILNQRTSPKTNYTAPPKHKIPVLGQLPNAAPLLIGETKLLSPMTPLQWRTILRSVDILHNRTAATFDSNATIKLAKADAAPLVAIVTPNSTVATLAAIVGVQRGKGGKKDRAETSIYDEMAQSLSESTPYFGDSSQVRVLGVGRAVLSEFSTALRERIQRISVANDDVEPDATKVVELVQDKVYHNNGDLVIMASMDLVMDDGSRLSERQETEYTDRVSPIHSLNKLSRCAFQLMMLHKDRQKLVQELQAAQSCSRAYGYDDERIGREEETSSAADLCPENKSNLSEEALRVSTLDNYGLGSTRTAVSDLAVLSRVLRDQILPYYSPSKSKTEEFDYSLLSWVALQSLAPYVNATTMKDMMELTNPAERMEEMHIVMSSHKDALKELADVKAEELQALVGSVSADIAAKKSSNSRMASKMKRLVNQNNNTLTDEEKPVNGTSNLATAISKIPFQGHQPKRKRPSFFLEHNETENYSYSSAVITNSTNTATDSSNARDETSPLTADPDNKSSKPYDKNKIPVLGPFINQPPLLIGASQWLSPPTPLQWKAIELCVENMHSMSDSKSTFATIDAAPLVAILAPNSEVATLAAIVGIRKAKTDGSTSNEPISDLNTTFDEYLASRYRRSSPYDSDDGEVRLLGIGRATLSNFTTLVREDPDVYEKIEGEDDINNGEGDEKISFVDDDIGCVDISEVESGEEMSFVEEDIGCADDIAEGQTVEQKEEGEDIEKELQGEAGLVVIADMRLVLDGPDIEVEQEEEFSKRRSSIHAVNRMSAWASKLYFLHQDRQQLVQELQATKSRMKVALHFDMTHNSNGSPAPVLSQEALRVEELDNYGLGTTRSAFSDLRALSSVLKEQLQPYYSESRFATEEFDYAAISWVALQSMETYMEEDKLKEIMASANTVDRMEQLYNVMLEHKMALKELVAVRKHVLGDQTLEAERNGNKIPSSEAEFEFDPDTIADMRVILDGPILERQYDEYTKRSSPVHALNKLSQWASRLSFVHKDLQKIARGLQTAQKRIDRASKRWEDWDGIGDLFDEDDAEKSIRALMSFLLRGAHNPTVASSITHDTMVKSADGVSFMLPLSEEAKRATQLDNYGLGSTRSSSSDLQTLAKALKEQVKPYFSPSRVETEEFHYCLTTWVALQLVKPYIEDATLKDIMKKQNTAERMERLYDIMMDHKKTLQELADAKCQEMRGCGADYTGLF